MVDANGKMRMEKSGWKNAERHQKSKKKTKRRKRMVEMNKQTKERNLSFKSLSRDWVLHLQNALSIVGTGYSGFFLNSLNPVIPFINVTETRTLRSFKTTHAMVHFSFEYIAWI